MNTAQRIDEALTAILSAEPLEARLREASACLTLLDCSCGIEKMGEEAQAEFRSFFEQMHLQPIPLKEAARHLKFFIWQAMSETEIECFSEEVQRQANELSKN